MLDLDENEAAVYERLQQLGGSTNVLSLQTGVEAIDALRRLEQRGLVRQMRYAVEISQPPPQKAKLEAAPEEQRTPELAALGRRVSFEPPQPKTTHVQGPLHDRVREMAGRPRCFRTPWTERPSFETITQLERL